MYKRPPVLHDTLNTVIADNLPGFNNP